jgi:hypothetical protein
VTYPPQSQLPFQMMSIDAAAAAGNVCRSTINNRLRLWNNAIEAGEPPPPGALQSTRWGGRRLIRDVWLARALGVDLMGAETAARPPGPRK